MRPFLAMLVFLACALLLEGCGVAITKQHSKAKLDDLSLGMTKKQVEDCICKPDEVRQTGSRTGEGASLEIWQYDLYPKSTWKKHLLFSLPLLTMPLWMPLSEPDEYLLYFVDDRLAGWGRKGDWSDDAVRHLKVPETVVPKPCPRAA